KNRKSVHAASPSLIPEAGKRKFSGLLPRRSLLNSHCLHPAARQHTAVQAGSRKSLVSKYEFWSPNPLSTTLGQNGSLFHSSLYSSVAGSVSNKRVVKNCQERLLRAQLA